jgi:Pin2-interacting protein X1
MSEKVEEQVTNQDETVSVLTSKPKRKRKFTWTEKRKAQFEKMLSSNREKSKKKKEESKEEEKKEKKKGHEKEKQEEEEEKEEVDSKEDQDIHEKEEKQSERIMKRVMDPHFLARKDRHLVGTTSEPESSSEESSQSEDESDSSDSEPKIKKRKKSLKVIQDLKLKRQVDKLRAKNKQLQQLFLSKAHKKNTSNYYSSEDSEPEPEPLSGPLRTPPSIFFC